MYKGYFYAHCIHPACLLLHPHLFVSDPFHRINEHTVVLPLQQLQTLLDGLIACVSIMFPQLLYLWDLETPGIYIFFIIRKGRNLKWRPPFPLLLPTFVPLFSAVKGDLSALY
jgi:hypothetical protein